MASTQLLESLRVSLSTRKATENIWALVAVAASCTLDKGPRWMTPIYQHAVLGSETGSDGSGVPQTRRRSTFRMLKETLMKSAILVGVPRVIESAFALGEAMDPMELAEEDEGFRADYKLDLENEARGSVGQERVYKHNLAQIYDRCDAAGMGEIKWLSTHITYGLLIAPCSDTPDADPRALLTFAETEAVVLACLISQRSALTTKWHLRGALRSGLTRSEIEGIQCAVERIGEACGVSDLAKDMPRVADIRDDEI